MKALRINTHIGLGDQVYMRPFIRALVALNQYSVYLDTSWPELWWDTPKLKLIPKDQGLRTQRDNLQRTQFANWCPPAKALKPENVILTYNKGLSTRKGNIPNHLLDVVKPYGVESLEQCDFKYEPPPQTRWIDPRPKGCKKPLALFHPPTRRKEWDCPSRNPHPEIWLPIIKQLRKAHHIHWVAFLKEGQEWLDNGLIGDSVHSPQDTLTIKGELTWMEMAAMMQLADVCVSPPGNWIPLGLAVGANVFIPFGGHVPPEALVDPCLIQYKGQWSAPAPKPFCFCIQNKHVCPNKKIEIAELLQALRLSISCGMKRRLAGITR